jgi:Tol biopolymer transport system component
MATVTRFTLTVAFVLVGLLAALSAGVHLLADAGAAQVAYVRYQQTEPDVMLVDVSRHHEFPLLQNAASQEWSPDGRALLYTTRRDGHIQLELHVLGDANYVIDRGAVQYSASWSPDGRQIVYSRLDNYQRLHRIALDPTTYRPRAAPEMLTGDDLAAGFGPVWSPDGAQLVYWALGETGGHLDTVTVAADAVTVRRLTPMSLYTGIIYYTWTADGSAVAYALDIDNRTQIMLVPADGSGTPYPLLDDPTLAVRLATWSPDGETIALIVQEANMTMNLYLMDAARAGTATRADLRALTNGYPVLSPPVWSADSTQVILSTADLQKRLYSILAFDVTTGDVEVISRGKDGRNYPTWRP